MQCESQNACLDIAIPVIVHLLKHALVSHSICRLHWWEVALRLRLNATLQTTYLPLLKVHQWKV